MIFRVKLTFVVVVQLCIICAICKHVSNNCSTSHTLAQNQEQSASLSSLRLLKSRSCKISYVRHFVFIVEYGGVFVAKL